MDFILTTPLYYVNDQPHLGSTYTTLACDALARFHRLQGDNVLFITGVDEHGQKIQRTAKANSLNPQEHCDLISNFYLDLWTRYEITLDRYIRTSSKRHVELVHKFYNRVKESGDIRIGRQKGWYCVGCEEYKDIPPSSDKPKCLIHQKELEWRDEENLFFCLSKYQSQIDELVRSDNFIFPKSRQNEIINFVNQGLKDFSISRVNVEWGINVPDHPGHTFYVWFDALLGYLSGTLEDNKTIDFLHLNKNVWPPSVHVIGKDILRFHAIYWPAMLMSAGLEIPKKVFGHGFLTREGQKMGKSLGNVLDPNIFLDSYGSDAIRWFLLRDIEFGQDGDYQHQRFIDTVNNDLSNTIGNLLNRTLTMSRNWFNGQVPKLDPHIRNSELENQSISAIKHYKSEFSQLAYKKASQTLIDLATKANIYLNDNQPWKKIKDPINKNEVANTIYNVLETCRIIGILIKPLTPNLSRRIMSQLGLNKDFDLWQPILKWGLLEEGQNLSVPDPVMNKIELKA